MFDISFLKGLEPGPDFDWGSGRQYRCGARRFKLDRLVEWPSLKVRGRELVTTHNRFGARLRVSARLAADGSILTGGYFHRVSSSDSEGSSACTLRFKFSATKSDWYFRGTTATGTKFGFWLSWNGKGTGLISRDRALDYDCWTIPEAPFDIDHASGVDGYGNRWSATFPAYAELAAGHATATGTFDGTCNESWTATLNPDRL